MVSIWVVVKIRVPFWVPEKVGAAVYQGPKKGGLGFRIKYLKGQGT